MKNNKAISLSGRVTSFPANDNAGAGSLEQVAGPGERERILNNPYGKGLVFEILWIDETIINRNKEGYDTSFEEELLKSYLKYLSRISPQRFLDINKLLKFSKHPPTINNNPCKTDLTPLKTHSVKNETILQHCPVCLECKPLGDHHIKPRNEGGDDNPRNIVYVCRTCHDILEELAEKGKYYTPELARQIRLSIQAQEKRKADSFLSDKRKQLSKERESKDIKIFVPCPNPLTQPKERRNPGRPRITNLEKASRQTKWRRQKEKQGVLL